MLRSFSLCTLVLFFLLPQGCADSGAPADASDGSVANDAGDGGKDVGAPDTGMPDGSAGDAGVEDAGKADTGPSDGGESSGYVVLAWNDLGMHCYNNDAADLEVLPPYNNLWAQVIRVGDSPEFVSSGITVSYELVDNSYSVGKTNFWTYAQQAFGLASPLPDNIGLKGKGLSGQMDWDTDHFIAEGIPATEFNDSAPATPQPFQQAVVTVRSKTTNKTLATATVVVPVSSEIHCENCHADDGDATTAYPITPTGKVDTNILTLHDYLNQGAYAPTLMQRRPVLCASCHSSNALGTPGVAGVKSLSNAIHFRHKDVPDITPDTDGCYNCHPGPQTKCLRDVMTQKYGFECTTCHGNMTQVAQNTDPWLNEPRCDSKACHGTGFALDKPLYRHSKGHKSVYCAACHDSPHALAQSREPRDQGKFLAMQGTPGYLAKCTVCHKNQPSGNFEHGME